MTSIVTLSELWGLFQFYKRKFAYRASISGTFRGRDSSNVSWSHSKQSSHLNIYSRLPQWSRDTSLPPSLIFIMKTTAQTWVGRCFWRGNRGGMQNQRTVRNTKCSPLLTHSTTQVPAIPGTEPLSHIKSASVVSMQNTLATHGLSGFLEGGSWRNWI